MGRRKGIVSRSAIVGQAQVCGGRGLVLRQSPASAEQSTWLYWENKDQDVGHLDG